MKKEFNQDVGNKKPVIFLFIMSVLTGILSSVVGHVIAAVCAGFLASLWHFETEKRRLFSYISIGVILVTDVLVNGLYSLIGVFAIVLGLMIFFVYKLKISKCESVFAMTLISSLLILLAYILLGMQNTEGLSVSEYYKAFYEEYKEYFVNYFHEMYAAMPELKETVVVSDEDIIAALDSIVSMLVSFIVIYGFVLTGIACKIFTIFVSRYSQDKKEITNWRFITPSVYAYFYLVLTLAGFFVGAEANVFALTVTNLSNIFMVVYAYIGWSCISRMLSAKKRSVVSHIFLFLAIIIFAGLALNILSFFGVFYTITVNKIIGGHNPDDGE